MKKNEESQELTVLTVGDRHEEPVVSSTEARAERLHAAVRESLRLSLVGELHLQSQSLAETVYNELAVAPVQKMEPLSLLRANMDTLEDLIQRWSFVMKENRYLLKADVDETN